MQSILLSTAYFPPISWMAAAVQSEQIEIELHETYPKQTFRNRCLIATSSGVQGLTVPVKRINGNHTKTGDICIENSQNWQMLHWRSLVTAYNNSPYFLYYRDFFEPVFLKKHELLVDINIELLTAILKSLNFNTLKITFTTDFSAIPEIPDLRNHFHPKHQDTTVSDKVFNRYIQAFEEKNGFISDLSIADLIFNLGPETLSYLAKLELELKS